MAEPRHTTGTRGTTASRRGAAPLLGAGTALVVVLHFLRPDVHPGRHYISEYGNDTWGWVLSLALLLIATGLFALAAALLASRRGAAPRLLQGAGFLLVVSALLSTDRTGGEVAEATLGGKVHGVAAIGAFALLAASMVALSPRIAGAEGARLGSAGAWALPLAALAVALVATTFMLAPDAHGIRQRAFLIVIFAWLLVASRQISSPEPGPIAGPDLDQPGDRPRL